MTHNIKEEIEGILYAPNLNITQGEYRTFIDEVVPKIVSSLHASLVAAVEGQKITNKSELKFVDSHLKTFEGGYNFALDKVLTIINSIFKE